MEANWTRQLIGRTVDAIERWDGGACVVAFNGGYSVQIESFWRFVSSGTLALCSGDEGQLFGRTVPVNAVPELSRKLLGHTLTAVQVAPGTGDLTLQFGGESLQAVADSSGYEAWQVHGPEGIVAVCQGGGNVAVLR